MNTPYTERNLISVVTNLFSAGTDTTASTLRWGLLLMAKYPHVQGKGQTFKITVTSRALYEHQVL